MNKEIMKNEIIHGLKTGAIIMLIVFACAASASSKGVISFIGTWLFVVAALALSFKWFELK